MEDLTTSPARLVLDALDRMPGLVRACHVRLGSPLSSADLEEVAQEASLTAWNRRYDFRADGEVQSWMYGIARICILRALGARRRREAREQPLTAETPAPIDVQRGPGSHADTSMGRILHASLHRAGSNVEAIVRAHELDGMTFAAIGEDLGLSEAMVKSRYYRCLPGLRRSLYRAWRDLVGR